MNIKKVLLIEDTTTKYMDIFRYLRRYDFDVTWVTNAEDALKSIEEAKDEPYDLIISDMHFDFFGVNDEEAGEKTMKRIREKGCDTPIVFCSSRNWKIPGAIGNIFYNPRSDWELEADRLFRELKAM